MTFRACFIELRLPVFPLEVPGPCKVLRASQIISLSLSKGQKIKNLLCLFLVSVSKKKIAKLFCCLIAVVVSCPLIKCSEVFLCIQGDDMKVCQEQNF